MDEYIGRRFKCSFIFWFLLGMVTIVLINCLFFYAIMPHETASQYFSLISSFHDARENLLPIMLIVGMFETLLAILFTLLLALFVSHKIGGPVYKLGQSIEQLKNGNLELAEIRFRTHDQGKILARRFNDMVASWNGHLTEMKYNYCKLAARITILENTLHKDDNAPPTPEDLFIKRMKHDLEKVQNVLDRFAV